DVLLERRQLTDERIDPLEVGDDLTLHDLGLGPVGQTVEAARDLLVLGAECRERGIDHQTFACGCTTASRATFSCDDSSRAVLSTMIVRPSVTTRPVMYAAASPFTIPGGAVICSSATCRTSVTASTTTPSFPPSHSRISLRLSSRSGPRAHSRSRSCTSARRAHG